MLSKSVAGFKRSRDHGPLKGDLCPFLNGDYCPTYFGLISRIPALPGVSEGGADKITHSSAQLLAGERPTHLHSAHKAACTLSVSMTSAVSALFHNSQRHIHLWGPRVDEWKSSRISGARGMAGRKMQNVHLSALRSFFHPISLALMPCLLWLP